MSGADRRDGEAGVTLIEMIVALVLFSLIGLAGYAMLDTILTVQRRTEDRMQVLERIDRALHLVERDVQEAPPGTLAYDGTTLSLERRTVEGTTGIEWRMENGLARIIEPVRVGAAPARQDVLTEAAGWSWRFLGPEDAWTPVWPPEDDPEDAPEDGPRAAEMSLSLRLGDAAPVRVTRLIALPGRPGA